MCGWATGWGIDHWHQGYATEAVRRMARLAFAALGMTELRAGVLADNPGSARVLAKLGFEEVGGTGAVRDFRLGAADWRARHRARPQLLVAAAALVDGDGRVLLCERPPGKPLAGLWEFPGGKVQPGETPEEALVRELDEELGLDVGQSCLAPLAFASHDYDSFHLLMPLFVLRTWRGVPAGREGQRLAWTRPARLHDLPMPPADEPLAALLRDWL